LIHCIVTAAIASRMPAKTIALVASSFSHVKAATRLEDNLGNPVAPWLYAISTLHCLTVSLAHRGAGLGAAWGRELACTMLRDAGFANVDVHGVPDDPLDSLYVARPT